LESLLQLTEMSSGGQDVSRRCARYQGGPDIDAFSVRASMQTDLDEPFASARFVGPLEMP
jgi:hypothetical protein